MKGWNLKMGLPNHLCLVKSWLRFACQLQLAKLCFQTESQLLINSLCKWIWHSLEILAVSSNQDIRIYKIYCIFVIGIHVELRLFGYSDFSWNIQICNLRLSNPINRNRSAAKISKVMSSNLHPIYQGWTYWLKSFEIDFIEVLWLHGIEADDDPAQCRMAQVRKSCVNTQQRRTIPVRNGLIVQKHTFRGKAITQVE